MDVMRAARQGVCEHCGDESRPAEERGRFPLGVVLCEGCWQQFANELAKDEGATATRWPEPEPDNVEWIEPREECRDCGMPVRRMATNYERWVDLAKVNLPAKDVPRRYRWRVKKLPVRHSSYDIGSIAVKIGAIDPLPRDLVTPA